MFQGSIPALVTPFLGGAVDHAAMAALVDWQIAEGSSALVPCGTTGEAPTLTLDEHYAVIDTVITAARGRVPVIAGCGSNDTRTAIAHVRRAKAAGAAGALVVCPYYNRPSQAGLVAHFTAVADEGLPVVIYNIPGRTGVDMATATMAELSRHPGITGVKESTGDIARIPAIRAACGHDFAILCGNDYMTLATLAHGGRGVISVTANVAPRLCAEQVHLALAGDFAAALALDDRLQPLHAALFADASPGPVKYALGTMNRIAPDLRLPAVPPSAAARAAVDAALAAL